MARIVSLDFQLIVHLQRRGLTSGLWATPVRGLGGGVWDIIPAFHYASFFPYATSSSGQKQPDTGNGTIGKESGETTVYRSRLRAPGVFKHRL